MGFVSIAVLLVSMSWMTPASAGSAFRDCVECPEMVVIEAGSFVMGSMHGAADERPRHRVDIRHRFAVGRFEVTVAQWDACVTDGGCRRHPRDFGWGRGRRPVVDVSWNEARDYVRWLGHKSGKPYRLPSEAEWEYAARGGAARDPGWGESPGHGVANCDGCGGPWDNLSTAPVGSFPANGFGVHDMLGNVWEWVADCWNPTYYAAPDDGRPWLAGDCERRVMRGGSWSTTPNVLRPSHRLENLATVRLISAGFRVARDLDGTPTLSR